MSNKELKLISLNVKDQPISKVLATIQESLELNLIYSKTVLSNEMGSEHLITAKIEQVEPEAALLMVVKSIGMIIEEFEDGHLVIRQPAITDDIESMDLNDDESDIDEELKF